MRPRGTRKTFAARLTEEEKREIVRLSKVVPRITQREIAKQFGCGVDTVRAIQKAASVKLFPEITPELENKIVAHLREGHGQLSTARKFHVNFDKMRPLMKKHGIHHRVGDPGLPAAIHAKVLEKVLDRSNFAVRIAEEIGVSRDTVLRPAHKIYGPGRFRNRGEPLTSPENTDANVEANCQKFAESVVKKISCLEDTLETFAEKMSSIYIAMIEQHLELWHSGQLPADRELFIYQLTELNLPKALRGKGPLTVEQWDEHRIAVAGYIKAAVEAIAGPKSGLVN